MSNNFLSDHVKVSYFSGPQVCEDLSQTGDEFLSLLAGEFVRSSECRQHGIICKPKLA